MTQVEQPIAARPSTPGTQGDAVSLRKIIIYCLAITDVATCVIHFTVSGPHYQEYWAFGLFMLATAWLQLLWAALVVVRPSRWLLAAAAMVDTGIVAVYIVTRTVGDMVGPTPHEVEPFGFGDGLCTVLEALVAAACIGLLLWRGDRLVSRRRLFVTPATTGAVIATLLSVALVDGGPEMVMNMGSGASVAVASSGSTQMPGMPESAVSLATRSPAGNITMPDPNMQMAAGMKMADASCSATPSGQQQAAAVSLVNTSWQDAQKYRSLAAAKAAGYRPMTPTGQPVVHYVNPAFYRATVKGGPVLNAAEPQALVYANTPHGAVLVASMFMTSRGGPTPQPGGCLTQWHVHTNLCTSKGKGVVAEADPTCPAGSVNRVTPPMLHVWFAPIPGGPTAVDATDAQVVHAAEQVSAPVNGKA